MTARAIEDADMARREAAAEWVLRLRAPDLTEGEAAAWLEWCEADPANRAAFEAMAEMWEVSGGLEADAFGGVSLAPANDDRPRPYRWAWAAAAAAVLAVIAAFLLVQQRPGPAPSREVAVARLETPLGRVRSTRLADGSRIELGGRSALSVHYSAERRMIVADQGEAFFNVAHDAERPFVVEAGPVTVTAIGTAFSVQRDGNSVAVTVTEGTVEVRATPSLRADGSSAEPTVLRASAGHRVRFDRGEITQSVEPVRPDIVAPWREGRLEFRDEPLRLVVARINRYSPRQLEISDPSIADLRVTTTVYHDRVDAWLEGIAMVLPVRVREQGADRAVISPAT